MDKFNLSNFIAKFSYKNVHVNNVKNVNSQTSVSQSFLAEQSTPAASSGSSVVSSGSSPQMGTLGGSDTSAYIKDLLKLPKNLNEFIYMIQRGYNQMQLNRLLNQQQALQKSMSPTQAQILAQLQGLSTADLQTALKSQLAMTNLNSNLKNLQILSSGMISLADLSAMIQANGKDAVTKLILTMAGAAKQGVTDLSQLKDTAKLINASIALASQENSSQTLKTILLLYLPWLPLQEGTDFELEVSADPDNEEDINILVITISTVNYGKVVATLVLETSNSVHVNIECSREFPKDELMKRISDEEKHYSMQSVISFQPLEVKTENPGTAKASVTMSAMSRINPFLLLMAHSIIRNIIMIDSGVQPGAEN